VCSQLVNQTDGALDFKRKKDSTLYKAVEVVNNDEAAAIVSAAASGPLVTGTYLTFRSMEGIKPAYAAVASTSKGTLRMMLDVGANMNVNAEMLNKYAFMGSEFAKIIGISKKPIVKQLNVGTEDSKGTELQKDAFKLMKENEQINFQGNIEGNQFLDPKIDVDVIVAEAFSGNVATKSYEGAFLLIKNIISESVKTSFLDKVGFLLAKNFRKKMKIALNTEKGGGGVVLGLNKLVIKAHGSSNKGSYLNSLNVAKSAIEVNLIESIREVMK